MNHLNLIQAYQNLIWDQKKLNAIDEYFKPDAIIHSPLRSTQGTASLKEVIGKWYRSFPNLKVHWDDMLNDKNKIISQWHAEGTQTGEFLGIPAAGQIVKYTGVSIYQIEDNQISEYWAYVDMDSIKQQLR